MVKLTNQKGFSAIEALLIFMIIAIIGGVGFFVYHSTNKASDTLNSADLSTNSPAVRKKKASSTDTTAEIYKFKEAGVQFALPATLKGMTYKVEKINDGNGHQVEGLYLQDVALTAAARKCGWAADEVPSFAGISREEGPYNSATQDGPDGLLKQFDTFYVTIGFPNGEICPSDDQALQDAFGAARSAASAAFVDAFDKTATEIK